MTTLRAYPYLMLVLALCMVMFPNIGWSQSWWECDWHYRTEVSAQSTVSASDVVVSIELANTNFSADYSFTADGADLRVLSSDNETPLDFYLESWDAAERTASLRVLFPSLTDSVPQIVYVYYGNTFANSTSSAVPAVSDPQSTFVEGGWRYHTRRSTLDPTNEAEARAEFDDAGDDNNNYGCSAIDEVEGRNNRNTFGGVRRNYGLYAETYFEVTTPGIWSFRQGIDFGRGGAIYINGAPLTERWNEDLWWAYSYTNSDVLSGSIYLSEGVHHYETLGFEGCCDGTISIQYQSPGSSSWASLSGTNLTLLNAGCPVGAQSFSYVKTETPSRFGGMTFLDNGDSGVAHNGVVEGDESALAGVEVTVEVINNGSSNTVTSDADGSWQTCFYEEAVGSDVTVSMPTPADHYSVSESDSVANSDTPLNATLRFPVSSNVNYLELNTGFIAFPTLSSDNAIQVGAGITGLLPHKYTPSSDSSINFQVSELLHQDLGSYSYSVFQDSDCNGELDDPAVPMGNPVAAQIGQEICLVISVEASTSVDSSSILELRIDAHTEFSGIDLSHENVNTDSVSGSVAVRMVLDKTVCNASVGVCDVVAGTGFTVDSEGKPEDELVYRLKFTSLVDSLNSVAVIDSTPSFTKLKPSSISVVSQPDGLNCSVVEPVDQAVTDFSGTIKWQCAGQLDPSQSGVVAFSVLIE